MILMFDLDVDLIQLIFLAHPLLDIHLYNSRKRSYWHIRSN